MTEKIVIDIFTPPAFKNAELNMQKLNATFGRNMLYASMGRHALLHILKAHNIKEKLLVPIYLCSTVLLPLKELGISPFFYDLDCDDLNANLESIDFLAKKYSVRSLLIASMYGNPANLIEIEQYCRSHNILLIDDAAQSFGATIGSQYVGTFGDAGFFSFSPGKPLAGHMGAFFWLSHGYKLKRTRHQVIHYLKWLDFYFRRLHAYKYKNIGALKIILQCAGLLLPKLIDVSHDEMAAFEMPILGGILESQMSNGFAFRQKYIQKMTSEFRGNPYFNLLQTKHGIPSNHKFVLIGVNRDLTKLLIQHLRKHGIYASNGYSLLSNDLSYLNNAKKIDGRVVEIPIEDDEIKMEYLFDRLKQFHG